jgi:hypothetical protein
MRSIWIPYTLNQCESERKLLHCDRHVDISANSFGIGALLVSPFGDFSCLVLVNAGEVDEQLHRQPEALTRICDGHATGDGGIDQSNLVHACY